MGTSTRERDLTRRQLRTMPPYMISSSEMSCTGKTVLVTGGAGYVGSHCVVELLKQDFNVICIDNFINCQRGHEYPESISRVQDLTGKQVTFHEADITSKDSLRQVRDDGVTGDDGEMRVVEVT